MKIKLYVNNAELIEFLNNERSSLTGLIRGGAIRRLFYNTEVEIIDNDYSIEENKMDLFSIIIKKKPQILNN